MDTRGPRLDVVFIRVNQEYYMQVVRGLIMWTGSQTDYSICRIQFSVTRKNTYFLQSQFEEKATTHCQRIGK